MPVWTRSVIWEKRRAFDPEWAVPEAMAPLLGPAGPLLLFSLAAQRRQSLGPRQLGPGEAQGKAPVG